MDERLRVGMQRTPKQFPRGGKLDDLPRIHHRHAIRDIAHDAEVMRDQQDAHAEPLFQVEQQFQNLRLDRHVQRGGRFIRHEQFGSLASAMAIITRCCMPPDISNG